jgi:mRNA interferase HicA
MKRVDLEKHLRSHDCELHHHGSRHDSWVNNETSAQAPVPRHREIKKGIVRSICRMLGIDLPDAL